ncbi:MAG: hypothetical protein GC159_00430 [Phycisphaera sp.]|nr:hypothetical protein [Phycisphaera sp.]
MAKYRLPILITLGAVILTGAYRLKYGPFTEPAPMRDVADVFGGPDGLRCIREADNVVAYRVLSATDDGSPTPHLADCHVVGSAIPVAATDRDELRTILTDTDSYLWGVTIDCNYDYGHRFDFTAGSETRSVVLFFPCRHALVYRDGEVIADGLFDPAYDALMDVTERVFGTRPSPELIQTRSPTPPTP